MIKTKTSIRGVDSDLERLRYEYERGREETQMMEEEEGLKRRELGRPNELKYTKKETNKQVSTKVVRTILTLSRPREEKKERVIR